MSLKDLRICISKRAETMKLKQCCMHLAKFKLFARSANEGNPCLISKKTINPQSLIWVNRGYHLYSVSAEKQS